MPNWDQAAWEREREDKPPLFVGIAVRCTVCQSQKQPHGRSASPLINYCDGDCQGYQQDPKPGCLWPGENDAQFGYPCCDAGARLMTEAEVTEYMEAEQ